MKSLLLCAALGALAVPALCQPRQNVQNNAFGGNGGATFQLPPSIKDVVSIDAQNRLIIVSEQNGETQYTTSLVQHVYSGGIARLFGGTSIPTAQFVTPGVMSNAQNGNAQNGNGQNNQNNLGNNGLNNSNNSFNSGGNFGLGRLQNGVFGGGRAITDGPINAQIRPR